MSKEGKPQRTSLLLGAIIVILVIVVGISAYFYMQESGKYMKLNETYNVLQSNFSKQETQLNVTKYNLTHPYTKVLYYQHTINLPESNSTYTYNSTGYNYYTDTASGYTYNYTFTWGRFNFSFYAPYTGYLIFNATSSIPNNPPYSKVGPAAETCLDTATWDVVDSNSTPYSYKTLPVVDYYSTTTDTYLFNYASNDKSMFNVSALITTICPLQYKTYYLPVSKGNNYFFIDNDNASRSGVTITFSAEYVGFHTS
jgi:hypothetical protein